MANSVDPDQMLHSAALFDLSLQCLLMLVWDKYAVVTLKNLDATTPYQTAKSLNKSDYLWLYLNIAECMENSVDPDQMLHSAASDLGLHCLLCPSI